MIVPLPVARKLLAGHATQVRLPAAAQHCPFRVGADYSVQPHRVQFIENGDGTTTRRRTIDKSIGRLQIVDITTATLGDLTFDDARREGFRTRDEHRAAWALHRGHPHDDTPVWVLAVKPHQDVIRLLAPSGSQARHAELDYTADRTQAMPDEPEAVDAGTLAKFAKDANTRDRTRAGGTEDDRLHRAKTLVRQLVDPRDDKDRDDVQAIERRLRAIHQRRTKDAA